MPTTKTRGRRKSTTTREQRAAKVQALSEPAPTADGKPGEKTINKYGITYVFDYAQTEPLEDAQARWAAHPTHVPSEEEL